LSSNRASNLAIDESVARQAHIYIVHFGGIDWIEHHQAIAIHFSDFGSGRYLGCNAFLKGEFSVGVENECVYLINV